MCLYVFLGVPMHVCTYIYIYIDGLVYVYVILHIYACKCVDLGFNARDPAGRARA